MTYNMALNIFTLFFTWSCLLGSTSAFNPLTPTLGPSSLSIAVGCEEESAPIARRSFLQKSLVTSAVAAAIFPKVSGAVEEEDIEVYFGCGCFWHVQHELVEAERRILGRNDNELTARAGYAGGKSGAKSGKVCYHNALKVSDYGALGHAEVVGLKIPPSTFPDFAKEYFALFNEQGYRPDQWGDKGLEYRNLVGFPGGVSSDYAKELIKVSQENGDKLDFAKGTTYIS
jgi:peptide methionine sulfoxide reductase MsrA